MLIADDDYFVRESLAEYLRADDVLVVGQCNNGAEAITFVAEHQVDVVLMDINMPVMDGIAATRMLRAKHSQVRVVMLTALATDEKLAASLQAGAVGYVMKGAHAAAVVDAVRSAHKGLSAIPIDALAALASKASGPKALAPALSDREAEVLRLLCRGMRNAAIARELRLAEATVKGIVTRLMVKLDVNSRLKAVVRAHKLGLAE